MKVWTNLSEQDLRAIVADAGLAIHADGSYRGGIRRDGRAFRFRLALRRDLGRRDGFLLYQRTSASYFNEGRKVNAVCWHGYRDAMRAILARDPDARIQTAFADYRGAADFEAKYLATGARNIGPMIAPVAMRDACACGSNGWTVAKETAPGVTVTMMRQADMRACPFAIFEPSHYRADGSCKCDDASERERMIAEWEYSPADFADIPLRAA